MNRLAQRRRRGRAILLACVAFNLGVCLMNLGFFVVEGRQFSLGLAALNGLCAALCLWGWERSLDLERRIIRTQVALQNVIDELRSEYPGEYPDHYDPDA